MYHVKSARGLGQSDCCLFLKDTDLFVKLRKCFANELQVVAQTGKVPLKLFDALLIRAQLPLDVQDIEGMDSVLQVMGQRAHNIMVPLASDRIPLKKGDPITAEECTSLHDSVMVAMAKGVESGRRLPVLPDRSPPELDVLPCHHVVGAMPIVCARFARAMYAHRQI